MTVDLSAPVTSAAGMPAFNPPVKGSWIRVGPTSLSFVATAPFIPTTTETLDDPGRFLRSPRGRRARMLAAPATVTFTVAQASTERLQQLLAQLGYLPLTFSRHRSAELSDTGHDRPGRDVPLALARHAGVTHLPLDGGGRGRHHQRRGDELREPERPGGGRCGRQGGLVPLLADVASGKVNANPYTYVFVSKQLPEALTLFENGAPKLVNIPVNTGAPGADTVDGTYPVFEHVVSSRMQGTNPDGSTYDDPNVPWASYFNGGDALHGFVRASYGFPQSNGCVEMPIAEAAQVWPLTPIGTLVTVVGPAVLIRTRFSLSASGMAGARR